MKIFKYTSILLVFSFSFIYGSDDEEIKRRRKSVGKKLGVSYNLATILNFYDTENVSDAFSSSAINLEYCPNGISSFILGLHTSTLYGGYNDLPVLTTTGNSFFQMNGYSFSLEYRYYKDPERGGNSGYYYSPYIRFRTLSTGTNAISVLDANENPFLRTGLTQNAFGGGLIIGYVYALKNTNWYVDVHAGYGYLTVESISISHEDQVIEDFFIENTSINRLDSRLGINIGYRFPVSTN